MSKCKIDDCVSNKIHSKGLCVRHWRYYRYGNCENGCNQPASNTFGLCVNCNKRGNLPPKTRRDGTCNKCMSKLDLENNTRCSYCRKRQSKDSHLKRRYGISIEVWEEILSSQGMVCKICSLDSPRFTVDHDHKCCNGFKTCGKCIRGIICENCNRALGLVKDNIDVLNKMIIYLENEKV